MDNETWYVVKIEKITKGMREQGSYEKVYDSEHPRMKEPNPPSQYEYRNLVKAFTDTDKILEQRVEAVDVERVLRAINRNL